MSGDSRRRWWRLSPLSTSTRSRNGGRRERSGNGGRRERSGNGRRDLQGRNRASGRHRIRQTLPHSDRAPGEDDGLDEGHDAENGGRDGGRRRELLQKTKEETIKYMCVCVCVCLYQIAGRMKYKNRNFNFLSTNQNKNEKNLSYLFSFLAILLFNLVFAFK